MTSLFKLLTGALEFIFYTSDNSPAQLGAYNLSTKTFSKVVTLGEFGSLFGDNIDYNADTNVLYTSTELLADGNPMTSGRLLSWDQKKVAAINSTFCWAIHSNVIGGDVLCLTEWPFYNFSSSSSSSSLSLSLKNLHTTRRSRTKSHIREALMNQLPLSIVSKKHALMTSNTAPLQQMQFIVSINPTSGSTSLVKRDWSDEDVPTNNCETLDRTNPTKPILYSWMSNVDTFSTTIYGVDATTGTVLTKSAVPNNIIYFTWEWNQVDSKTYGIVAVAPAGKAYETSFASLDLKSGTHTVIAKLPMFDNTSDPIVLGDVSTLSEETGTFFTLYYNSSLTYFAIGIDISTGKINFGPEIITSAYEPGQFIYRK
jgi:hypothetical protein